MGIRQMMKPRKDTPPEKKGKRNLRSPCKNYIKGQFDFLNSVRDADLNIRGYVNERKLKKHKSSFLKVVHFNVYDDKELLNSFKWSLDK